MKIAITSMILIFGLAFSLAYTTKSYSFAASEQQVSPLMNITPVAPAVTQAAPPIVVQPPKMTAIAPKTLTVPSGPVSVEAQLKILSIGVVARIKDMGLTPAGAMAVPNSTTDVGWYSPGTRPGNVGSAVIGGHNEWHNTTGVFARLEELSMGDVVTVVDEQNVSTSFIVRETRVYKPTDDATEVFTSASGSHLNLITCSGTWDPSTNSYTERFVVFTDLQNTEPVRS